MAARTRSSSASGSAKKRASKAKSKGTLSKAASQTKKKSAKSKKKSQAKTKATKSKVKKSDKSASNNKESFSVRGIDQKPKRASTNLSKSSKINALKDMLRARIIDQKIITLYKQNKCHFQIGVAGHECIQVATSMVFNPGVDWFYPYYRDMALVAGLGMTNEDFFLMAMNKQDDPNSHGRQMPMHYGHLEKRIVNQSSPTGTQFLQAVGCALGASTQKLKEVVYVSSGEGSCSQGDFHEALNWAARDKLPIVFVIQNNGYAISVPIEEQLASDSVAKLMNGYNNLECTTVDGTNLEESYKVIKKAYDRAKKGIGPCLVEAFVPRLQSHSISDNHLKYRSQKDIDKESKRCPIALLEKQLVKDKVISKGKLKEFESEIKAEVDKAAEWAEEQADPAPSSATDFTFSDPIYPLSVHETEAQGEEIYMVDALNHALDEEMKRDQNCFIFGQDVAHGKGGVFTVTSGLTEKYGKSRVFNTQLAESSIAGVAIGMATRSLNPIAEIQFGDYVWTAMMQIRNELAMMHYRSGGDFKCPAVIRIPVGGYIHGSAYHSQCIEATFSHFPGLYVIMPSNATDAKGLLKTAIRCDNPVLFLEHKGLYRQVYAKGPEGDDEQLIPFGRAKVVKEGEDLTILTYGALVHRSFVAAQHLEMEGASVEVIDLRSIVPLDLDSIVTSVQKTNRVLIAHEDVTFMGFGAEIAAQIADHCFEVLDAPIRRVGMRYAAAVPHAPVLEDEILPQMQNILDAARDLLIY